MNKTGEEGIFFLYSLTVAVVVKGVGSARRAERRAALPDGSKLSLGPIVSPTVIRGNTAVVVVGNALTVKGSQSVGIRGRAVGIAIL